ncbi:hypothetical protein [Mangrovibacterium marinum]|uniref:hypothetical protein n=1 Tax=Mangrovibacterium marinum TaxID=1639118 RepID=UPI002A189B03|nr:hypothetical protein [Mangrovibacterium marinum]
MKGFTLRKDNNIISGAIKEGITSIILTNKDGVFRLTFGSMDKTGMHAYTWYASDLEVGDTLQICYTDIVNISEPQVILDYNSLDHDKLELDYYHRLKKELIEEGVLPNDNDLD